MSSFRQRSSIVAVLLFASTAVSQAMGAIVIDVGPTWTPPGLGATGSAGVQVAKAGGKTFSYSAIDLGATANLYYGVKAIPFENGFSMDGGVNAGSAEIFRYSSHSGSTIVYTGSTVVKFDDDSLSTPYDTRLTVSITGTGSLIQDTTTASYNSAANGDVEVMWDVQSDFSANWLIEVEESLGVWTPGNDFYDALGNTGKYGTGTSVDDGFYYQVALEPQAVPEPTTLALVALGLAGMCYRRRRRTRNLT